TAAWRGWELLRNGELVAAGHAAGFDTILTRESKFAESASKSLKALPTMALVVIKLRQRSWSSTPTLFATLSKNIPTEIPIFAIRAAGAHGSRLRKDFALDAVVHRGQRGAGFGEEGVC